MSASSTLHEPLTSMRIFAFGRYFLTALMRARSSLIPVPTFIFTASTPGYQERICSISASSFDAGTVALIGIDSRSAGESALSAASIALSNHGSDS